MPRLAPPPSPPLRSTPRPAPPAVVAPAPAEHATEQALAERPPTAVAPAAFVAPPEASAAPATPERVALEPVAREPEPPARVVAPAPVAAAPAVRAPVAAASRQFARPPMNGAPTNGAPQRASASDDGSLERTATAPQLRRFIKSRAYVPMHELRRRFGISGGDDEVTPVDLERTRVFVGLPEREGRLLGELLRGGDIGYELSMDPISPIVVGVYPMRPVTRV